MYFGDVTSYGLSHRQEDGKLIINFSDSLHPGVSTEAYDPNDEEYPDLYPDTIKAYDADVSVTNGASTALVVWSGNELEP